ncbi:hypothetical protein ABMA27_004979 [Loxostege sticticalis]|uniref:Gustatory receptor n=1 Tax=Loxostege sticticalis TaxID=481309 RepID=A0ABR3HLB1_LOXSC
MRLNFNPLTEILWSLSMITTQMIPLFSPCMISDRVHGEVRRLRELLASRLYENNLDKSGRSAARALLMLTKSRDLSFIPMGIFKVDISLPFKVIGLLVTYLIIILQFHRVFDTPSASTPSE